MKTERGLKVISLLLVLLIIHWSSYGQTIIKGFVRDAVTQQPLQFASIYFKGGKGTVSGADGSFSLETNNSKWNVIEFSYNGYKTMTKTIIPGKQQHIDADLEVLSMNEVIVKTKKRGKYSNKNNPAVELIRNVIDNKNHNRVTTYDYVQYQQYEKLELSLLNKPEKLMKNRLFKNYRFLIENQDTSKVKGKSILPVYLEEKLSEKYYRKDPKKEKTYILGEKKVDFGEFVDNNGVSTFLNRMYADIDVYENNITLLTNQFLSPIADISPSFYRFYILDTVVDEGIKLVRLSFTPKNPNDLLFRGTMSVTLDGNYAVQKMNMGISKHANLNWTNQLKINLGFEKGTDSRYHLINSNMLAEFALTKGSAGGLLGERTVSFKNFMINQPADDSVYNGKSEVILADASQVSDSFWLSRRHIPLSGVQSKVYTNMDSLKNMPSFRRFMDIATLVLAGYKSFGTIEVGPVNTFYSFNPVEGFRLRAGGRTTPKFSKNIYFENYMAYGFKDEKWKYFLSGTWSFNHKSVYSFPLNYLRISYQYDTKIPGQELQFVQEDNFLLSFKRGNNDKWLYNNTFKLEHVREFGKNISYTLGFKNWKQTPAGAIVYEKISGTGSDVIPSVTTSELSAELKWAPHEQFYQGKNYRIPIANKYPIFRVRYIAGIKGLVNGEYNYHNLNTNIYKRFYFSQLGYADVVLEGGYIFGKLPYPLLTIHRANQTYAYQLNSYNLMNFMEFVSDRYASMSMDYYFNGFIFNKIPLLKKLKLREVASVKILYGSLRDENDPSKNPSTFKFPTDNTGLTTTFRVGKKPYLEASIGIANIFKLIRVDVVKRLSYLDNPGIPEWGIRARTKFDF